MNRFARFCGLALLLAAAAAIALPGCLDERSSTAYESEQREAKIPDPPDLKTTIDDLVDYTLNHRLLTTRDQAAWQVLHGLEAYGRLLPIEHDGQVGSALEYLFNGGVLKGWVIRPADHGLLTTVDAGSKAGQGHPDQWLGYLSQCGVKLDDPIIVGSKTYHVSDLLEQAKWEVYDGEEASWLLMAADEFLPVDAHWRAKDKSEWSFERLVAMEAAQPLGSGGCFGTHRMYALAKAVNRYRQDSGKPVEKWPAGWQAAYRRVMQAKDAVERNRWPDGTLSTAVFLRSATSADLAARIYSGGHTLEFLAVALDQKELNEDWVTAAVARLCEQMNQIRVLEPDCGTLYHAAHGLILYRNARFGPRAPVLLPRAG